MKYLCCQNQTQYQCQAAATNLFCRKPSGLTPPTFRQTVSTRRLLCMGLKKSEKWYCKRIHVWSPCPCLCLYTECCVWHHIGSHQLHLKIWTEKEIWIAVWISSKLLLQWADSAAPLFLLPIQQSHLLPISCFQDDELSCLLHCLSVSKLPCFLASWSSCHPVFLSHWPFNPSLFLHNSAETCCFHFFFCLFVSTLALPCCSRLASVAAFLKGQQDL